MERYVCLILLSCQATQVVDNLVDKIDELRESIRVSKFLIGYVPYLPHASVECYLDNYKSFKENNE